ncbi:hypothetical protein FC682_13150 [Peribacillus simplex]|uniref:hypothetical protein n=1 Tax=Peribacillus simplex TaxID=1478 RepID=UPI0010BECF1C|nr:hypothetical protein [Peribacillus simplex]TKH04650.1 hypothetical protein FC682_13150 [Peribacillus simplex]
MSLEQFSHENGAKIREIERLHVNFEQILVRYINLLVNLMEILVNSNITQDFELFPHEME